MTGVLADLARQVGLALHNSQLDTALQTTLDEVRKQADALRESRARIVASGDAERRRVERNLHDGAQQHLVALAVNLRLANDIIVDDQEAGLEMLDQLAGEVQETIQELRELAHGIYPPLLVDSGLVEALRAAANRNPLPVDIVAEGIGRYSLRDRGGRLLLLPRGAPERGQACARCPASRSGCGRSPADFSSLSPTTGPGSTRRRPSAGTATSTWQTALVRSVERCAGSPQIGKGSQVRGSVPLV